MIAGRVLSLKKQIARHQKELANLDALEVDGIRLEDI